MIIKANFEILPNYAFFNLLTFLTVACSSVFCNQCNTCAELNATLRILGMPSHAMFGKGMTQERRLEVLNLFKSKQGQILVATDVASRGLDIPLVDVVINYDISDNKKTYIHRVGRTARAGRTGHAITIINQYSIPIFQELEAFLKIRMSAYGGYKNGYDEGEVELLKTRVQPAIREGKVQIKEADLKKGRKRKGGKYDPLDDSEQTGILDTFTRKTSGKKNRKRK